MSRYYQLKTARPLPETYIPVRLTQRRDGLTSTVDGCMAWRSVPVFADDEELVNAGTLCVDGDETIIIDPMHPEETTVVELDLEDPVVALQLLLRYREVLTDGSNFVRQVDILTSLIATDDGGKRRRRLLLYNLLLELDVQASPAKES